MQEDYTREDLILALRSIIRVCREKLGFDSYTHFREFYDKTMEALFLYGKENRIPFLMEEALDLKAMDDEVLSAILYFPSKRTHGLFVTYFDLIWIAGTLILAVVLNMIRLRRQGWRSREQIAHDLANRILRILEVIETPERGELYRLMRERSAEGETS